MVSNNLVMIWLAEDGFGELVDRIEMKRVADEFILGLKKLLISGATVTVNCFE